MSDLHDGKNEMVSKDHKLDFGWKVRGVNNKTVGQCQRIRRTWGNTIPTTSAHRRSEVALSSHSSSRASRNPMSAPLLLPISLSLSLLLIALLRPILCLLLISPIIPILRLLLSRRLMAIIRPRLREVLRWRYPSLGLSGWLWRRLSWH